VIRAGTSFNGAYDDAGISFVCYGRVFTLAAYALLGLGAEDVQGEWRHILTCNLSAPLLHTYIKLKKTFEMYVHRNGMHNCRHAQVFIEDCFFNG
jgi:hypothetical protein